MKKIMRIGKIKVGKMRRDVFVEASFEDGNFSMHGVVGPMASGNCYGGCGQIDMAFEHRTPEDNDRRYGHPIKPSEIDFAPGWDADSWFTLLDIWTKWHLNDLQAGCEHQQAEGWGKKALTVVKVDVETWRVRDTHERWSAREAVRINREKDPIKKALHKRGFKSRSYFLGHVIAEALEAASRGEVYEPKDGAEKSWFDAGVIKIKTETTSSGWTRPDEHPEGVLTKPCPVCGYKYGTAWMKKVVPDDIISFVWSRPDADVQPAWI